jgi:hypothetical protein
MILLRPVFIIAIVAVAMIGIMGIGYMDSANAKIIEGDNIPTLKPYCPLDPYDINNANGKNSINVNFNAYTRHYDLSAVIQMNGKIIFNQFIPDHTPTKISETFEIHEQNSHRLEICLIKNKPGSDYRMMDITNVKHPLGTVTPPKTSTPNTHTPSTPIPDVVKSIDCALKQNPQFDRYYEYGSQWEISIDNPHPNNCKYEVKLYDSAKNYVAAFNSKLISTLSGTFDQQEWSDGEYLIVLKSMQNGKSYGYYPLTIVDKTTPIDPTIILIIIAVAGIAIIAVGLSKRKKETAKPKSKPKETEVIEVHEFVKKCEGGTQEDMFTIMKRKYSDEEYRKILLKLLGDLNKINADNGIKMIVFAELATIPEQPKISKIPNRPDAPRLANASTTKQPLRIIVTWTEPNDGGSEIISYDVCRSKTGKSKEFSLLGIQGKDKFLQRRTDFIDIVPTEGTWYYQIVAHNSIGASPPSLVASITVGSSSSGSSGSSGGSGGSGGSGVTGYTKEQREAYNTLGISPGASDSEIKTAHQKLIIKYHPDKATDSQRKEFTAISTNVNLARSILLKK